MSRLGFWKGAGYEAGYFGVRLLVLGEAAYARDGVPAPTARLLVECHLDPRAVRSSERHWLRTYTRFVWIMSEAAAPGTTCDRKEVWQRLAFQNYLLKPGGSRPRQTLPEDDPAWREARPAFETVLAELKPEAVVVWGQHLWGCLERCAGLIFSSDKQGIDGEIRVAPVAIVPAFRLRHPSSCPKVQEWGQRTRTFLTAAQMPRPFNP